MSKLQNFIAQLQEQEETLKLHLSQAEEQVKITEALLTARKANYENIQQNLTNTQQELADAQEFAKSQESKTKKTVNRVKQNDGEATNNGTVDIGEPKGQSLKENK